MTDLMKKPLCIDLFCGLGGFSEGMLAEGWDCIGFDVEQHVYGEHRYPAQLVVQDVLTLHGSQFKGAALIVASPPCQFFSYCAMPWSRAKGLAAEVRACPIRTEKELALFNACFRIQREACEAAGHHIPLIVENVRGIQPWVGRARWSFGSFYLYGDVPALMPIPSCLAKVPMPPGQDSLTIGFQQMAKLQMRDEGLKQGGDWFAEARKGGGGGTSASFGSKSPARKMASAMIAKIPEPLSRYIGRTFHPNNSSITS